MGLFSEDIAIDLGTANTLIIHNDKVVVNSPSIVAIDRTTNKVIAIGEEAKEGWEANPDLVPEGSVVFAKIEQDIEEQKKTEGVSDGAKLAKFIIAAMVMHSGIVTFFP